MLILLRGLLLSVLLAAAVLGLDTEHIDVLVASPFKLERHAVVSDGYRLGLFRILREGDAPPTNRTPVLLHHGFFFSANVWFPLPREQGLPYILYDAGYDVWAISDRGTTHSRSHETLSPLQREFWRYTFDDLALVDLPAFADYVLAATGRRKLATVTWSAGATQTYALGSAKPDVASARFCHHVAVAPVFFPQRIATPLEVALLASGLDRVVVHWDAQLLLPAVLQGIVGPICAAELAPFLATVVKPALAKADAVCDAAVLSGYGVPSFVPHRNFELFAGATWPTTLAAPVTSQIAQSYRRGPHDPVFLRYNFGKVCGRKADWDGTCNQEVYGSKDPPSYDLSQYTIPTTIIRGGRDKVSVEWDNSNVAARLPPGVLRRAEQLPAHSHLDFTWYDTRPYSGIVLQALRETC